MPFAGSTVYDVLGDGVDEDGDGVVDGPVDASAAPVGLTWSGTWLTTCDVDGDGLVDFVSLDFEKGASIFLGAQRDSWTTGTPQVAVTASYVNWDFLACGDIDGDGFDDVIALGSTNPAAGLEILYGRADLAPSVTYDAVLDSGSVDSVVFGDIAPGTPGMFVSDYVNPTGYRLYTVPRGRYGSGPLASVAISTLTDRDGDQSTETLHAATGGDHQPILAVSTATNDWLLTAPPPATGDVGDVAYAHVSLPDYYYYGFSSADLVPSAVGAWLGVRNDSEVDLYPAWPTLGKPTQWPADPRQFTKDRFQAVPDVDCDGQPDLLVAARGDVRFLGSSRFASARDLESATFAMDTFPRKTLDVLTADIDHDGVPDLGLGADDTTYRFVLSNAPSAS